MEPILKALKDVNINDDVVVGISGGYEISVQQTLGLGPGTVETARINGTPVYGYLSTDVSASLTGGVKVASIGGRNIYAPSATVVQASAYAVDGKAVAIGSLSVDGKAVTLSAPSYGNAASDVAGLVRVSGDFSPSNYALQISSNGYAYVTVPMADKFCQSAWYDPSTRYIYLSVGDGIVSCDVAGIIKGLSAVSSVTLSPADFGRLSTMKVATLSVNGTEYQISAPSYGGDGGTIGMSETGEFGVISGVFARGLSGNAIQYDDMTIEQCLCVLTRQFDGVYGETPVIEYVTGPAGRNVIVPGVPATICGHNLTYGPGSHTVFVNQGSDKGCDTTLESSTRIQFTPPTAGLVEGSAKIVIYRFNDMAGFIRVTEAGVAVSSDASGIPFVSQISSTLSPTEIAQYDEYNVALGQRLSSVTRINMAQSGWKEYDMEITDVSDTAVRFQTASVMDLYFDRPVTMSFYAGDDLLCQTECFVLKHS